MRRRLYGSELSFRLAGLLLLLFLGGCSLIVDFDRSLLRDGGMDGSLGPTGGAGGEGAAGGAGGQGGAGGVAPESVIVR